MQIGLNHITDALGADIINIDPFAAGVLTLGFIYGAYFAETFRGAFLSVPGGQLEAAAAYGMTRSQSFRRILFPQMMRFALPGIGRSEEHTSELQSLMRITYAVFCLKKN